MIFYNWKKILWYSQGSTSKIIEIIRYLTFNSYPRTRKDIFYKLSQQTWTGNSFLKNPDLLLKNRRNHKNLHVAHYIGLASLRNYAEYKIEGTLSLDFLAFKEKEALINKTDNRLLYIKDDLIHFLYEENPKGITLWH
jgi:hypothetical protein